MKAALMLAVIFSGLVSLGLTEEKPLRVGAVLPLTGPASEYGTSIVNAIELARQSRPEEFKAVEIRYEDARYDAAAAVTAFHKLTERDRVDIVFTWGISFCQALAPLAEERRIPLIAECIDPALSAGRKFVLRPMNYSDQYTAITAKYLLASGRRKLALVLSDTNYTEMMRESLVRMLQPGQSVTLVDSVSASDMDFRSCISKLRQGDFDAVGVFLSVGQVGQFFRQARQQKLNLLFFGTNIFESLNEIRLSGGAMNGAIYAFNYVSPDFVDRYTSLHGEGSQLGFAGVAYEVISVLARIASVDRTLRGERLLQAFASTSAAESEVVGHYDVRRTQDGALYFDFPVIMKAVTAVGVEPAEFPRDGA